MSNLPLGQIITTPQARDAIHVAVAPVIASETLHPGQHIGLVKDSTTHATALTTHIGIVDPYLRHQVSKGQQFWLFLYPQTVTGLRHDWSHPAWPEATIVPAPVVAPAMSESETWLREYVRKVCPYYYEDASTSESTSDKGYSVFLDNARRGEIHYSGSDLHSYSELEDAEELFKHLSVVLGRPVSAASFDYTCSC